MTYDSGSSIGLSLSQALMLTGTFQWAIRQSAEVETMMTSVERVHELNGIEREHDNEVEPPEHWPTEGRIDFQDMCLQYEGSDTPVLKDITLSIKGGETVSIVAISLCPSLVSINLMTLF